jgi:hypothetical protein
VRARRHRRVEWHARAEADREEARPCEARFGALLALLLEAPGEFLQPSSDLHIGV